MAATIIDGTKIAEGIKLALAEEIKGMRVKPCLATVLVGDNPASKVYVSRKNVACRKYGFAVKETHLPEGVSQDELLRKVRELNADAEVHGILVQLPLPKHISEFEVISAISPAKDVDGLHPLNQGLLFNGKPSFVPCTPRGVLQLIKTTGVELAGKKAVVIGRSNLVGKPAAILLSNEGCTVTVCHSKTVDLAAETRQADVLVSAVGKPGLVTAEMVKQGAIVIDVGTTRAADGKLRGDVDFESVREKASFLTPVPGGVGPMTIAMLLRNTLEAARRTESA